MIARLSRLRTGDFITGLRDEELPTKLLKSRLSVYYSAIFLGKENTGLEKWWNFRLIHSVTNYIISEPSNSCQRITQRYLHNIFFL